MKSGNGEDQDDFLPGSSKRRKGFPSERMVKRGIRIVHGDKELTEKLGRDDPCPWGSRRSFQEVRMQTGNYDGTRRDHYF